MNVVWFQKLCCLLMPGQRGQHYTTNTNWIPVCLCVLFSALSFSRIIALYQGKQLCVCLIKGFLFPFSIALFKGK